MKDITLNPVMILWYSVTGTQPHWHH